MHIADGPVLVALSPGLFFPLGSSISLGWQLLCQTDRLGV